MRKLKFKLNIRSKILLLIILVTAIISGIGISLGYYWGAGLLRQTIEKQHEEIARRVSYAVSEMINEEITDVVVYASNPLYEDLIAESDLTYKNMKSEDIRNYLERMNKRWSTSNEDSALIKKYLENAGSLRLRQISKIKKDISEIFITDRYGGLVASSGRTDDFYQADEEWWQKAYNDGKGNVFIGNVEFDDSSKSWCMPIAVPVRDGANRVIGACKAVIKIETFFSPLSRVKIGKTGYASLANENGDILFGPNIEPLSEKIFLDSDLPRPAAERNEEQLKKVRTIHTEKNKLLSSYVINNAFLASEGKIWRVVVMIDREEVFAPLKTLVAQEIRLIGLICVIMVIFGLVFGEIFANSIKIIYAAIQQINKGNWNYRAKVNTGDELEELADAFNEMLDTLQKVSISKEHLDSIIDNITDILIVVDRQLKIKAFNKTATESLGYAEGALLGKSLESIFVGESLPDGAKLKEAFGAEKYLLRDYETNLKSSGGKVIPVLLSASVIRDNEENTVSLVCTAKDIAERKQMEKALLESESRFRTLTTMSPAGVYLTDAQGDYLYVNPRWCELTGLPSSEAKGSGWLKSIHPDDREYIKNQWFATVQSQGVWDLEYRLQDANNGEIIWVLGNAVALLDEKGSVRGYIGTNTDITQHKKIEEEVRNSEIRFKELFNRMKSGVAVYEARNDGNDFIFKDFNRAAEQIDKIGRNEVVGRNVAEVFPGVKEFGLLDVFKRVWQSGNPELLPISFYHDNRISGWRENYCYKLPSGEIISIYDDVTERKQAEEKLKESEEHYRIITNTVKDFIWTVDMNLCFTYASPSLKDMLGYNTEEIIGHSAQEILAPDSFRAAMKLLTEELVIERLDNKDLYRTKVLELQHRRKDGLVLWGEVKMTFLRDEKGNATAVLGVTRDITERKQAEEKLLNAAEEWRTTFDSIADLVSIHDKNFKIVRVNKAFADAFKMKYEDILGKNCFEIFHGLKEPMENCPCQLVTETKTVSSVEFFEPALGIYLETTCSPIINKEGEVTGIVHIVKDINRRKDIERKERLAQLGKLVADMAHEVNNPLMVVSGRAQLSLMEKIKSKELKKNLMIITSESLRARDIIQRLLRFSRPSKEESKEVNINNSIDTVVALIEHQFNLSGVQIRKHYASGLPNITIDEQQMQEVFMNLMNNAKDAMPEGGAIEIITSCEKDYLKIDFKDTGYGMPEQVMKRILEPFFTTKEKGTGLGLAVCYGIIKAHGGELKFESKVGRGTTVSIFLPLQAQAKKNNV